MFLPGLGSSVLLQLQSTRRYDDRATASARPGQIAAHPQILSRCVPFSVECRHCWQNIPATGRSHEPWRGPVALLACFDGQHASSWFKVHQLLRSRSDELHCWIESFPAYWFAWFKDICPELGLMWLRVWSDLLPNDMPWLAPAIPAILKAGGERMEMDECMMLSRYYKNTTVAVCSERSIGWKRGQ